VQSEDEDAKQQLNRQNGEMEQLSSDKRLLDSSMNNRLEPIPKHAFKPYYRKQ
jgi:hypothetical protein